MTLDCLLHNVGHASPHKQSLLSQESETGLTTIRGAVFLGEDTPSLGHVTTPFPLGEPSEILSKKLVKRGLAKILLSS